jgi:hypothetical protein
MLWRSRFKWLMIRGNYHIYMGQQSSTRRNHTRLELGFLFRAARAIGVDPNQRTAATPATGSRCGGGAFGPHPHRRDGLAGPNSMTTRQPWTWASMRSRPAHAPGLRRAGRANTPQRRQRGSGGTARIALCQPSGRLCRLAVRRSRSINWRRGRRRTHAGRLPRRAVDADSGKCPECFASWNLFLLSLVASARRIAAAAAERELLKED